MDFVDYDALQTGENTWRVFIADQQGKAFGGGQQNMWRVGTLATFGAEGLAVQEGLALEFGLAPPLVAWHTARDSFAEAICFLGLVSGTLSKIATDAALMMQTEVEEVYEPFHEGRG